MNKLLKKYLAISKIASDDPDAPNIVMDSKLKQAFSSGNIGKFLLDVYGVTSVVFAEPGYLQFKFIFNCLTESFALIRYPGGTRKFKLEKNSSNSKEKEIYKLLMDKGIMPNGWIMNNIALVYDDVKIEEIKKLKEKSFTVVDDIKEEKEKPKELDVNKSGGKNLIIGDSQIQGFFGKALEAKYGGYREGISSKTATYFLDLLDSGSIKTTLEGQPANIFILFGGNGTSGIAKLIDKLHIASPNSKIIFFSLPSPAKNGEDLDSENKLLAKKHKTTFGSTFNYQKRYDQRKGRLESTESQISSVSPSAKKQVSFQNIFDIDWYLFEDDKKRDGIHLTERASNAIVAGSRPPNPNQSEEEVFVAEYSRPEKYKPENFKGKYSKKYNSRQVNPHDVYAYLMSKGMSNIHALGIIANIQRECAFYPAAMGDGGTSGGFFQMHAGRYRRMVKAVPDWKENWKGQIDHGLETDKGPKYLSKQFSSAGKAADWWETYYERPAAWVRSQFTPKSYEKILKDLGFNPYSGNVTASNVTVQQESGGLYQAPVKGTRISSPFGMRTHPIKKTKRMHNGLDIAAPTGTPIYPIAPGTVIYSGVASGYGNVIYIDHGNDTVSRYAHCDELIAKKDQKVELQDKIATVGETGAATGPHLHLEIRVGGRAIDPKDKIESPIA